MRRNVSENKLLLGPHRRCGFTLVELLVVIGIIAVLVAILLPVLGKARAQANRAVCLSNIRQLGTAILLYCNDNDGYFPTCAFWDNGVTYIPYPEDWIHWQSSRELNDSAIAKYVGRGEKLKMLLRCPADTFDGRKPHPGIAPGQGPYLYSYAMNRSAGVNARPLGARVGTKKITQWRAPARKILLTERFEQSNTAPAWDGGPLARRHGTGVSRGAEYVTAGSAMATYASAMFFDNHVDSVTDDFACNLFHFRPERE